MWTSLLGKSRFDWSESCLQVGAFGNCSESCGGGVRNRTTVCVNEFGQVADAGLCPGAVPADQIQCNVLPCNFCDTTNCAGQVRSCWWCCCAAC